MKKLWISSVLVILLCMILLGSGCGKKPQYTLTIGVEGDGTTLPKPGIHTYEENTVVTLKTTPAAGSFFDHWAGTDGKSVSSSNTIVMNGNKSVKAVFVEAMMEIVTQPATSTAGQPVNGFPSVKLSKKADGTPIPNVAINVAEKTGLPFQGTRTILTDADGIAVFDDLVFYEGTYKLVFSLNNLSDVESDFFSVSVAGAGTVENPYLIHNLHGLMYIETNPSACFRLENDIDASATADPTYNDGKGWLPIGQSETGFYGQIDGNGKTISGLYINRPNEDYVGLIKWIKTDIRQTLIKDLHLADVAIIGRQNVGGLIAGILANDTSVIENCSVTGEITGMTFTGGMFGAVRGIVTNCHTDTIVSAGVSSWYAGGLAGFAGSATISNCFAFGIVTGHYAVEGLLGTAEDCSISQCYAFAAVNPIPEIADSSMLGGFVGWLQGDSTVADCYSRSTVVGNDIVAGFCGYFQNSTVVRCYSAGAVSPSGSYGGFIAFTDGTINISNCYYDSDTSGCSDTGKGEPLTTAEMLDLANYDAWDFAMVWNIGPTINDGYPYLRNTPTE